jgi:hypothetical protein
MRVMADDKQLKCGDPWTDEEEREFQAMMAADCKPSKKKREVFVKVPIGWAERYFKSARAPRALVCVWLLHLAWKAHAKTFALPNGALQKMGVSHDTKSRTLAALERDGLIKVERRGKKAAIVTLLD